MPNLDLSIAKIMQGDTPVLRIMKGDTRVWPSGTDVAIDAVLTNITSSISLPATVALNGSFTVTLTANVSHIINQISITMGGVDITSTAYNEGIISIAEATDDVLIVASALEVITFQDAAVKALCVQYWGGGVLTGEITPTEAASVHDLGKDKDGNSINGGAGPFYGNTSITSFDEFIYFTGINTGTGLYYKRVTNNVVQGQRGRFAGCTNLKSIKIPQMITTSLAGIFYECKSLEEADLSQLYGVSGNTQTVCFDTCRKLKKVVFPEAGVKPTNIYCMFGTSTYACSDLEYVDFKNWDFSNVPTTSHTPNHLFRYSTKLVHLPSGMHNLAHTQSFQYNTLLSHDSAVNLLNSLATVTGQTITFAADTYNTLTAAEIAIGTNKGWTVTSA